MKITIIGAAGVLGSCSAFNLISNRLGDEIVLIDQWASMLRSHWLDLNTVTIGTDIVVRSGTYNDLAESDIVIEAAAAPEGAISSRSELLPSNLPIIKEHAEIINKHCPGAIVIIATNPVDPLNYAMYLLSKNRDRRKILGYSLNDSIRFRIWCAEALAVSDSRVQGLVIGEHGHSQVMLFSTLTVDGKPVKLDAAVKQNIKEQPPKILQAFESLTPKRTAGWTTAIGIADMVRAIIHDTRAIIPTNIVLKGEYGARNLSMTMPAVIGKDGMQSIEELKLAEDEQAGLKHSIEVLQPLMRYVEEKLGIR